MGCPFKIKKYIYNSNHVPPEPTSWQQVKAFSRITLQTKNTDLTLQDTTLLLYINVANEIQIVVSFIVVPYYSPQWLGHLTVTV